LQLAPPPWSGGLCQHRGEGAQFTEKAYSLGRCERCADGSWEVRVAVDPKLVVDVVAA
jgi:hypothetical protein